MSYSDYLGAHDDFVNRYQTRYGSVYTSSARTGTTTTSGGQYASGISDSGFMANTCTDGIDDGKIGLGSILLNMGEGVLKGAVNGITGMFTDSNGNFSLAKTLTTVAIGGLCVTFPVLGVAACAVGAVSGGTQLVKGAIAASNATTDAEAKAAWENIGAGGSTVVGCVLGAKASMGAMKGSSTAAIDDTLKSFNNMDEISTALKNANIDNTDDVITALKEVDLSSIDNIRTALKNANIENVEDITSVLSKLDLKNINNIKAALEKANIDNAHEIAEALKGIDLNNVDDVTKALKDVDTSALGQLKGQNLNIGQRITQTLKAFGKDAVSSSKNNGTKLLAGAKNGLESLKSEKSKIQSEIDDMTKALENTDDIDEITELNEGIKLKKQMLESADDSSPFSQAVKEKFDSYKETRQNVKDAQKNVSDASKTLEEAKKSLTPEQIKTSSEVEEAQKAYNSALEALQTAKSQTPFGQLTSKSATYSEFSNALKSGKFSQIIKSANPKTVLANLKTDGINIYNYLRNPNASISQAVSTYGYENTMEVLKVIYAINQTNSIV